MFDLLPQGDLKKWGNYILGIGTAGLVSFMAGWSASGLATLYGTSHSPLFALVSGFFGACGLSATAMLLTAKKSPLWKELKVELPEELRKVVEQTDVSQPNPVPPVRTGDDAEVRKVLE